MSLRIRLLIQDDREIEKIEEWLNHSIFRNFQVNKEEPISKDDIVIIEIKSLLDWVKVRRMKKQYKGITIFPLVDESMIKTSPLAIELQLPSLFTKPMKRNHFYRHFKKILAYNSNEENNKLDWESFRDIFWRRVLKGEVESETELSQAFSLMPSTMVPNLVCVIQGFVRDPEREKEEGWEASSVVQKAFLKSMSDIGCEAYFVPFHKHAALMLKIPAEIATPSYWKIGEKAIFQAMDSVRNEYGIQLYIGVGSITRKILKLKDSYENAKIARRTVAKHQLSLRYYDEIPSNISVQKSVDYIRTNYTENISMNEVATTMNFSPAYFSRLFKKETGHSFVSYLTIVRVLRSIWLLRQTDQTIEQIAMELGFNTPNYFSATFKKEIGLSPSQYRATKEILFCHKWSEDDF